MPVASGLFRGAVPLWERRTVSASVQSAHLRVSGAGESGSSDVNKTSLQVHDQDQDLRRRPRDPMKSK